MLSPRQLWSLLTPLTVLVCALFGARTAGNLVEGYALGDQVVARRSAAPFAASPRKVEHRSKDGSALVATNMFCSTCKALEPTGPANDSGKRTQLPLRLIATNISSERAYSFASVMNTESQRQGAYRIGQEIPNAGIVTRIGVGYLDFARTLDQGIERIDFQSGSAMLASRPAGKAAGSASSASSLVETYVRVVDETHVEIDRDLVGKLQGNAQLAGAQARPVSTNGHMTGVRLFGVRTNGLAHSIGLRNGDTVVAANGVKLESLEAALELMGQIQQRDHWSVDIERAGKPMQLQVDLH